MVRVLTLDDEAIACFDIRDRTTANLHRRVGRKARGKCGGAWSRRRALAPAIFLENGAARSRRSDRRVPIPARTGGSCMPGCQPEPKRIGQDADRRGEQWCSLVSPGSATRPAAGWNWQGAPAATHERHPPSRRGRSAGLRCFPGQVVSSFATTTVPVSSPRGPSSHAPRRRLRDRRRSFGTRSGKRKPEARARPRARAGRYCVSQEMRSLNAEGLTRSQCL